jgi:hypothetical protein
MSATQLQTLNHPLLFSMFSMASPYAMDFFSIGFCLQKANILDMMLHPQVVHSHRLTVLQVLNGTDVRN